MKVIISLLLFSLSSPLLAFGLTPKQLTYLENHDHLLEREMISNAPWPQITMYLKIKATPEEAMALYSDFEQQKNYVPNILESTVINQLSPKEVHTRYELKMPWPLSNSRYTHGTVINKINNNYSISWYVVESDSTEKIDGLATFENFGTQTLMTYRCLIYPKSIFASLFANTMVSDTQTTTLVIRDYIQEQVRLKSREYNHSLELLRKSLAGKMVFVKKK